MFDKIKTKNLVLHDSKAVDRLATLLVGIAPKTFLKGVDAQAEARLVKARKEIEVRDLLAEADRQQQLREQGRLISIIDQAAPQIGHDANPDEMDEDWRENFRVKARHVTADDMQAFWGRLLATETNRPGTISKRAVNAVSDMDRKDAEKFTGLCRYAWMFGPGLSYVPVFDKKGDIYRSNGITLPVLQDIESMGLVTLGIGYSLPTEYDGHLIVSYFGRDLSIPTKKGSKIGLGAVVLTDIGSQISAVVDAQYIPGFYEYCREKWCEE